MTVDIWKNTQKCLFCETTNLDKLALGMKKEAWSALYLPQKYFLSKISISLFIAKKPTSYECLVSLVTVAICKSTQKSQFLLSQAFKWKKIMFFVITEMPSKTFVMVLKKLPDHFKRGPESISCFQKPCFSHIKNSRLKNN